MTGQPHLFDGLPGEVLPQTPPAAMTSAGKAGTFAALVAHTKDLPAAALALTRLLMAVDLFPQGEH